MGQMLIALGVVLTVFVTLPILTMALVVWIYDRRRRRLLSKSYCCSKRAG